MEVQNYRGSKSQGEKCILYHEANEGISQAFEQRNQLIKLVHDNDILDQALRMELWKLLEEELVVMRSALKLTGSCENNYNERNNLGIPAEEELLKA